MLRLIALTLTAVLSTLGATSAVSSAQPSRATAVKVTVLSTMLYTHGKGIDATVLAR
jgi:hypothetical protein